MQSAAGEQQWLAVGEHPHQKIRRHTHLEHIEPAARPVAPSDCCGASSPLHGAQQTFHITPAEIEPLATHGMAAVARFADQHAPSAMKAASQEPLLWEGSGLIQKEIRFNPLRQNSGQLIEKGIALQCAALLATLPGCTPHHLERALPQGQN